MEEKNWDCSTEDILSDIKDLVIDDYNGILSCEYDNKLIFKFDNGQAFVISVKEIKD